MRFLLLQPGRTKYGRMWALQKRLHDLRCSDKIEDVLILLEHYPVYTFGKHANGSNLLLSEEEVKTRGIELFHVDRGGDITYHGPGQLVGYPIIALKNFRCSVRWYVQMLEETIIRTLSEFGIKANRRHGFAGVWLGSEKIAAIGIRIHNWVTMHGFALNVNPRLEYFSGIIPCGIHGAGVTSMEQLIGEVTVNEVARVYLENFQQLFGYEGYVPLQLSDVESMKKEIL